MKKFLLALLALVLCFSMIACSEKEDSNDNESKASEGPDGTYYCEFEDGVATLKLDDGEFEISGGGITFEGTYELDGDKLTLTAEGEDEPAECTYDADKDIITMDGQEFTKEKPETDDPSENDPSEENSSEEPSNSVSVEGPDGTYYYSENGLTVTLIMDDGDFEMSVLGEVAEGTYTLDGENIVLTAEGEEEPAEGTYDADEDIITLEGMEFTKEKPQDEPSDVPIINDPSFSVSATLDGRYTYSETEEGVTAIMVLEFDDNDFSMTITMEYEGEEMTEAVEGTYTFDGEELVLTAEGTDEYATYNSSDDTIDFGGMIFEKE